MCRCVRPRDRNFLFWERLVIAGMALPWAVYAVLILLGLVLRATGFGPG